MTALQLDLLAAPCARCQTEPYDCICSALYAVKDRPP